MEKKNKQTIDILFVSFIVTYDTKDSSTAIMFEKPLLSLPFAGKNASRVLCLYLLFAAFLDLDLQKHIAKTLVTRKEQGSYAKRMQPSLSFVCTTILRPPESFEKLSSAAKK